MVQFGFLLDGSVKLLSISEVMISGLPIAITDVVSSAPLMVRINSKVVYEKPKAKLAQASCKTLSQLKKAAVYSAGSDALLTRLDPWKRARMFSTTYMKAPITTLTRKFVTTSEG